MEKKLLGMQLAARHGIALLVVLANIAGCGGPQRKEIQRLASPDKVVDAVLVEITPVALGAITSTAVELYIVPHDQRWTVESPLVTGDHWSQLRIAWREPRFLEIRYARGQIFTFQNVWDSPHVEKFMYRVELRLLPDGKWTIDPNPLHPEGAMR